MITERTLRRWRAEALIFKASKDKWPKETYQRYEEGAERILRMTQELLDIQLIERSKSRCKNIRPGI